MITKTMKEDTSVLPTELDVLCGKGNTHHQGNIRFRRIVADHHQRYPVSMTKHHTMRVSKMILVEVLSQGGRFLRKDSISCKWYVADGKAEKNKISHCVRETKRGHRLNMTLTHIADRRQHPVSRAQAQEEPALGGQPRQESAPWEAPFQEMLVGHPEHQQMLPSSIGDIKSRQRRNSEPHDAAVCDDMYPIWDQQMLQSSIGDIKRKNSEPYPATVCNDMDPFLWPSSSMGDITPYSVFPPESLLTLDDARKLEHTLVPFQQCQESETHSGAMRTSKRSSLNTQHDSRQVRDDIYPIWDQQMLPSSIGDTKHCHRRKSEPHQASARDNIYPHLSRPSMGDMNPNSIFPSRTTARLDHEHPVNCL
jgi:hypothetical protein